MIYGYDSRTINEYGLKEMREISVAAPPCALRELATFLMQCADELESAASAHWHRHASASLKRDIGCEVVVLNCKPPVGGTL
jgi:hypothetical protein